MRVAQPLQLLPLFLFLGLSHIALAGSRVLVSLYALHLQSSALTVGILIGLFALFPTLLAVAMGRMIDRIGAYRPMLFGAIFLVTGTLLPSLFPQVAVLYPAAILMGTGHVLIQVSGQMSVGTLSTAENRAGNFGMLAVTYSLASLLGPLIAGFMIDAAGHRATFMLLLAFVTIGLLMHLTRQVKVPPPAPRVREASGGSAIALMFDVRVRDIFLVGILLASAWDLYTFVLPIRGTQLGFSASTIGIILSCFSGATLVIRIVMPFIYRHFKEWQILHFSLLGACAAYLAMPFISSAVAFMIFSFMLGLVLGCGQPNLLSLLHVAAPPGRGGEALGVRLTMGNATQTLLPLFFGAAGAALGIMPLFWGMAAIIGIGVPFAHRQVRNLPRPEK